MLWKIQLQSGKAYLEKGGHRWPVNLDHFQVGEAVDTAHVKSHNGKDNTKSSQNLTEWNYKHADRYETCGHHNDVIRISPENIAERIVF